MNIRIIFSGLCLFTPDQERNRMVVLFPMSHDGMDRHVPILEFDTAYLSAGSSSLNHVFAHVPLRDQDLDFPGTDLDMTLCPQVVNLRPVTGNAVDPALLADDPEGMISARVTLAGGSNTAVGHGKCWAYNGQQRSITHQLEWTIETDDTSLQLTPRGIGAAAAAIPLLHPVPMTVGGGSATDTIVLYIHHVPAADLPPDPQPVEVKAAGFQPEHFGMFYMLYGATERTELPTLLADDCEPSGGCPFIAVERGGSPFTCVVGSSVP